MKYLSLTIMMLLLAVCAQGQTVVNLSVTDTPDNQTWNNGTWTVKLIPGSGNLSQTNSFTLLVAGGNLSSQSGSLSSTGTASISLPANINIGPAGTVWQFTVCSQQGTACSISNVTVVTSSPQTVALTPSSIRVSALPNLPPIVVYTTTEISSASIGSQITVVGSTPATPALQTCTAISGSTCTTWAAAGGGLSFGPQAFTCANCNPNVQYAYTVTCNSTTAISTGANDPPFVAADVGKIIVGTTAANIAANCPPQGTIQTFTDAHHVVVSVAATASATTTAGQFPSLAWGSQDDGANLRNAFLASLGKGCFYLPAGNMFAGASGSDGKNLFVDTRASTATGQAACVIGQNSAVTPLPTFNYSGCVTSDGCAFTWTGQGIGINPNYALLKDWLLIGLGYNLTGTGTTNFWINWQRVTLENVWLWGLGGATANGYSGSGPNSVFSPVSFGTGSVACAATGGGALSASQNQIVTIEQGYCNGANGSFQVGANAYVATKGMQFGTPPSSGPTISTGAGSVWVSTGDGVSPGNGTADSVRVAGTAIFNGSNIIGGAGNTLGALDCNASGANIILNGGVLDGGGTGGLAIRSIAGCNIKIRLPVTLRNYAASLSGNNVSDPSETQTGSCTTNAATVTFKLNYAVAPLVLVSDTTSASTGAQATSTNLTTATIHCNGASDTFVATVIPNPI